MLHRHQQRLIALAVSYDANGPGHRRFFVAYLSAVANNSDTHLFFSRDGEFKERAHVLFPRDEKQPTSAKINQTSAPPCCALIG